MRLFAGLPLPPGTALAVESWSAEWRRRFPSLGWVAARRLHISLHFFGELPQERATELTCDLRGLRAAAIPAIPARTGEVARFPPRQRPGESPRVLFLALDRGGAELSALQARYAARISALGHRLEERPFVPHLTLARVRDRGRPPGPGLEDLRGGPGLDFVFDRVVLYQSILRPEGPEYRPLETLLLEPVS